MKAVVFHGIGNISLEEVKDPQVLSRKTTRAACVNTSEGTTVALLTTQSKRQPGWIKEVRANAELAA
jgi:hypothetical protein